MSKTNKRFVVGLTGTNAAGKGEIANFLQERGYRVRSLSDVLREEASNRGLSPSREVLISLGNELRTKGGPGALASHTLLALRDSNYCIDSIRNPAEIQVLRGAGQFLLIGIDALIDLRFERAQRRGRTENASTIDEFRNIENREKSSDPNNQQIDRCLELSDLLINNDGSLDKLRVIVEKELRKKGFPT